ncbi:unnamed protein product [Hermetia illucens]|uniref:Arginase n=2 Tax=Hermetia illucens TaxID=343691 RepID=A0A7R8YVJ1_HERIL|nr:unnamed protein product [Hermetia illucens]
MLKKALPRFQQLSRNIVSSSGSGRRIGIVGVPLSDGQAKNGTELAPEAIRNAGLQKALNGISGNIKIKDYGDIRYTPEASPGYKNMENYEKVIGCNKVLFEKMKQAFKENDQVLTLGGDHSMAIGSVLGHLEHDPDFILVWIDAHADINLNVTSPTGHMHGMPVSFLMEEMRNLTSKFPNLNWTNRR